MSGSNNRFPFAQVAPPGQMIGGGVSPLGQAMLGRQAPAAPLPTPHFGGMSPADMNALMKMNQGTPLAQPTTVQSGAPGYPSTDALMNAPQGQGGMLAANPAPQGLAGQAGDAISNAMSGSGTPPSYNTATPAAPGSGMFGGASDWLKNLFASGAAGSGGGGTY
jgi:hypothetical protein